MLEERARAAEERNTTKVQQLTREVEEYLTRKQAEMDSLKAETAKAKRQCIEFSARREVEEKRMADLISPFLEGQPNPVTVGNQTAQDKPA
jgi:tRNA uridine 5-carbamoylmethylation protein Kti12